MAQLKIRIELQRSRTGIEMSKLERLSSEAQKLLRYLGEDMHIPTDGTWVAQGFYDQGVGFDATYQGSGVDDLQARDYLRSLDDTLTVGDEQNWTVAGVSVRTLVQSAVLARVAGEEETVRLGLSNGEDVLHWRPLAKSRAHAIAEHFNNVVEYRGMLQGVIHAVFKEADPPHFKLRDRASGDLVDCEYEPELYGDLHAALKQREAVVLVTGWVHAKRSSRSVESLRVERIRAVPPMTQQELEAFFGSAPPDGRATSQRTSSSIPFGAGTMPTRPRIYIDACWTCIRPAATKARIISTLAVHIEPGVLLAPDDVHLPQTTGFLAFPDRS